LVKIASYLERTQADLAITRLEAAKIPSFLADENMTRLAWLYVIAFGGIRIFVPKSREIEARTVLEKIPIVEDEDRIEEYEKRDGDFCPNCNSSNINYTNFGRRLRAASLLAIWFGIPLILWGKRVQCDDCRFQYKPDGR
jgi:hypothetical protein